MSNTRDRPLFSPTRRPPAPPPVVAAAPPPPPPYRGAGGIGSIESLHPSCRFLEIIRILWALSHGMPASQDTVDQVRYLRLLGVPFGSDDLGVGSGNRISYRFEHLIELGLALFGLRRGLKPKDIAAMLAKNRPHLRRLQSAPRAQPSASA